jgi:hypothetical protein
MKAKFIGDPNDGFSGPHELVQHGVTFVKGQWSEVPAEVFPKLARNSHFEVEADPLDHDGDGKKGGAKASATKPPAETAPKVKPEPEAKPTA